VEFEQVAKLFGHATHEAVVAGGTTMAEKPLEQEV